MSKTKNAFVLIHFGSNEKYLELELYFCMMLQKYTRNNIVYMYSEIDTPISFVNAISPFVYRTQGFNDSGITYNVSFESKYTSFNTLRTCDFIFAYTLTEYEKICIIESDLVIMSNIDSIFNLNSPSILCYRCGDRNLNKNVKQTSDQKEILAKCTVGSDVNGGVMLITPSEELFHYYVSLIPAIAKQQCKYPNEALFECVNNTFYNLPIIYNLSHYLTLKLSKYGLNPNGKDIIIFHFNETEFKHIDIIKEGWLRANENDPKVMEKYRVKKIPITFFEKTIYNPRKEQVNSIMSSLSSVSPLGLVEQIGDLSIKEAQLQKVEAQVEKVEAQLQKVEAQVEKVEEMGIKEEQVQKVEEQVQKVEAQVKQVEEQVKQESDWVEAFSNKYQQIYWSNKKTRESVWEKPKELYGGKIRTNKRRSNKRRTNKRRTNKRRSNKRRM